jgi:hypothetical protein
MMSKDEQNARFRGCFIEHQWVRPFWLVQTRPNLRESGHEPPLTL